VADKPIAGKLRAEMEKNGAYWVDEKQKAALERTLFFPNGAINPRSVGKTPQQLAKMAGISVPARARVLVADLEGVGKGYPLSREKLTTVLGFYVEDGWRAGCERCIQLIKFGGDGHSLVIHAQDEDVIMAFGLEKPVFRVSVNTWGAMGAIGATTGLMPALTLAPGGVGGAVVSDNITVTNLMNIKRLAYPLHAPPELALELAPDVEGAKSPFGPQSHDSQSLSEEDISAIVRRVLAEIRY
jgi:acetaldehyde dehydrogenase (acetylating)